MRCSRLLPLLLALCQNLCDAVLMSGLTYGLVGFVDELIVCFFQHLSETPDLRLAVRSVGNQLGPVIAHLVRPVQRTSGDRHVAAAIDVCRSASPNLSHQVKVVTHRSAPSSARSSGGCGVSSTPCTRRSQSRCLS